MNDIGPSSDRRTIRLDQLPMGEPATIQSLAGDDSVTLRLMEMGVMEGELIELIGAAPLGDPLEFRIRGYNLSLRRGEAARVLVEPPSTS